MKLVGDPAAEAWLEALSAEAFEWDSGNRSKNAKHQVEPSEVASLLQRTVFLSGRIVETAHDEPRWLLVGRGVGWRSSSRAAGPRSGPAVPAPCVETNG